MLYFNITIFGGKMQIHIKNKIEIKNIKKSCQILAEVKQIVYNYIRPGVSLKELDSIAFNEIVKRGAQPAFLGLYGFKHTMCISVNEELIHGIPSDYILKDGDIVSCDLGCIYKGMNSDSAFTKGVGTITPINKKLINVAKQAFEAGVAAIKPGARVGDISYAIGQVIRKNKFYTPDEYCGHGIGYSLHEEPNVFNDGLPGSGPLLKDGMVICIEPMVMQKNSKVKVKSDGWTVVSASGLTNSHYEHTVLIQDGKGVVLTKGI
ncbi:methionine aminopeptidase (MAP) [Mycoplasmopsis californica HAZ160_1]|uniref:Methionine aminopeptidase n=2 Tax=Mycoplasmopsis californica TaxID=2113 RepID=A0AAT9F867_9BACT|nr:type I methionyl aminopeptidase [Mycoplasmopsis californica]BAP01076.1 methionine aminopeptidase (MAP) [Mycoplasmopsis californica HAZ160_1]BBG40940.1 methionine aminopeptidase [Mycoplasmopsis californica]BBG41534.1 methionine aminopeptidase [Mycoplasmopsis californica]BBG42127.1 methionine aminopeptidase [Mycoplasmopsis californica]BBG42711.1 methionine aminopeptidase [Mycoplasmopsis californica]